MCCAGHLQPGLRGIPLRRPTSETTMEDFSKPVATFTQASSWSAMPDNTKLIFQTPEMVCTLTALPTKMSGDDIGTLPEEVVSLQEEMNRAMGHLLTTRASMDTHWRKQVLDFEMAICQNEAKATEAIREAKAHCGAVIREAETCCALTIREAEAQCTTTIREAEAHSSTTITEVKAHCAADIREEESHTVDYACFIQQSHGDDMQCLEMEAIEEEGKHCQSFLAACGMVLQVCLLEAHGVLMCPLQMLMGNMSLATFLSIPFQVSTAKEGSNFPPNCSGSTQALLWNQVATLFACLRGVFVTARRCTSARRWSCWNLWRTTLPEVEEQEASQETLVRGSMRSLLQGLQFSVAG